MCYVLNGEKADWTFGRHHKKFGFHCFSLQVMRLHRIASHGISPSLPLLMKAKDSLRARELGLTIFIDVYLKHRIKEHLLSDISNFL